MFIFIPTHMKKKLWEKWKKNVLFHNDSELNTAYKYPRSIFLSLICKNDAH